MPDTAFFTSRGIECERLPEQVITKARAIIEKIEAGSHFQSVGGKRMFFDKALISIPVDFSHRIIARDTGGGLKIKKVCTHEAYNKLIRKR